jgi:hypothetical protein
MLEISSAEIKLAKISTFEISSSEVGAYFPIFLPPSIPNIHTLLEKIMDLKTSYMAYNGLTSMGNLFGLYINGSRPAIFSTLLSLSLFF